MKNIMTVDQLMYAVCSVENHDPAWLRDALMRGLENEGERMKYKNYNDQNPEEREKYAPKDTRFTSGKDVKI